MKLFAYTSFIFTLLTILGSTFPANARFRNEIRLSHGKPVKSGVNPKYGKLICLIDNSGRIISTVETKEEHYGITRTKEDASQCNDFSHHGTVRPFYIRIGGNQYQVFQHNDEISCYPLIGKGDLIQIVQPCRLTIDEILGKQAQPILVVGTQYPDSNIHSQDQVALMVLVPEGSLIKEVDVAIGYGENEYILRKTPVNRFVTSTLPGDEFNSEGVVSFGAYTKTPAADFTIVNASRFNFIPSIRSEEPTKLAEPSGSFVANRINFTVGDDKQEIGCMIFNKTDWVKGDLSDNESAFFCKDYELKTGMFLRREGFLYQVGRVFEGNEFPIFALVSLGKDQPGIQRASFFDVKIDKEYQCRIIEDGVTQRVFGQLTYEVQCTTEITSDFVLDNKYAFEVSKLEQNNTYKLTVVDTIDNLENQAEAEEFNPKIPKVNNPKSPEIITNTNVANDSLVTGEVAKVEEEVNEKIVSAELNPKTVAWLEEGKAEYSVYFGYDYANKVRFVGITTNPDSEFEKHAQDAFKTHLNFGVAHTGLTENQARALEQYYKFKNEQVTGRNVNTSNKYGSLINLINEDRELIHQQALAWAQQYSAQ